VIVWQPFMLRLIQHSIPKWATRCYPSARYCRDGRGIVGSWGGKGACRLGLEGTVDRLSFRRLCDNRDPQTGTRITWRMRSNRTVGYNFRFSVSKSVSLLFGMTGDLAILDAFRAAVGESMREMEGEMKCRVRNSGQNFDRTTGNMVWAEFVHTTSGPVNGLCDPQLHAAIFVFNMTWDNEQGQWKAGKFRDLKQDSPYFQAAFRVRMANKLQDLGFGIVREDDDFEVAGIPSEVLDRFSRRTTLIETLVAEQSITDPRWKREIGPRTRERKGARRGPRLGPEAWKSCLAEGERQVVASVYRRDTPPVRKVNGEALAVDQAIEHCVARAPVVSERALLTEALKLGLGAVTVEGVAREVASRPFVRSEKAGRTLLMFNGH
jgi:conjugative relaxase-like TrwC/TraI family protein